LLALIYFNWIGSRNDLKEFTTRMKEIVGETDGISLNGVFVPISEW